MPVPYTGVGATRQPAARGSGVPNRSTAEVTLDQWNDAMRATPWYQGFLVRQGLVGKIGGWSRAQQSALERELADRGVQIPSGMHIDQGGNLNQTNRTGKRAAIVGAAALAAFGIPGLFPGLLNGAIGGGAGTGAGVGGGAGGGGGGVGAGGVLKGIGAAAAVKKLGDAFYGPDGVEDNLGDYNSNIFNTIGRGYDVANDIFGDRGGGQQDGQDGQNGQRSLLNRILDYAIPALTGADAINNLRQGPTPGQQQLEAMLKMATGRAEATTPLFDALNRMAMGNLPRSARG